MATSRTKVCVVHFFELVIAPDRVRVDGFNWQDALRALGLGSTHECEYNGSALEGLVSGTKHEMTLSLAVDRPTTPRQRNTTRPERAEMQTLGNEWEPVEETFVRFFSNNIVGLVRSTNSAPTHAALAQWLNQHCRPAGYGQAARWFAQPIVDEERYLALQEMGEVTSATFAVKPATIRDRRGMLGGMFDRYFDYEDGLRVEVHVSAGRGRPAQENRARMLDMARDAADLHSRGVPFDRAVVNARPLEGGRVEVINLLEHKLTKSFEIEVGGDGATRSLPEVRIFAEIQNAFVSMQEALQDAIGL
ncbi:hypothetical protein [Rhodococcus sp. Chr-9]|uniref:hypothetical protein n=1 Tax=Rhodococcus sp. Chr-9 TaxID=713612 RepID=UPI0005751398|nr:hypothetical protein [Rhodococcus sp. Chr-9]KHJ74173.1 hypothetical protein QR64_03045 [Rhodococcus sp. Chr-9]